MVIRKAIPEDLAAITEILNQAIKENKTAYDSPVSLEQQNNWFDQHDDRYPVYVSCIGSTIAGWLSFSAYRKGRRALATTAEISFYVHENFRYHGIGKSLIEFALEEAGTLSFKHLFAVILENNTPSISLVKHYGFELWAHLPSVVEFQEFATGHVYYGRSL